MVFSTRPVLAFSVKKAVQMATLDLELSYGPSGSVRAIETEDGAALLDIQRGICLSMNAVGIEVWRGISTNNTLDEIAETLTNKFHCVPRLQIEGDIQQFIAELKRQGLLESPLEQQARRGMPEIAAWLMRMHPRVKTISRERAARLKIVTMQALLGLFAYDVFRLGTNFSEICAIVCRWPTILPTGNPELVDAVCRAVNYACVWYPKRVLCLQRSVVTACLLRHYGIAAQMVLGAQKFPFKAHAWTEVDGHAVNERRDVQSIYLVWERC
jgi:hypothetical protein